MKRILVIEDDPAVRGLILETLRFRGWQPLDAPDGEQGLRMAKAELPDLIICDIQMPKMDGYGVLRQVRADPTIATVPFVFLTGLGEKPKMRQAMESGADDYITKPFTVKELLAAVDARFQKQAVIEESADKKLHELRESLSFALPHELVTPLNTILGFSGLLLDSASVGRDELHEYAQHIQTSAHRLRSLIEKFLLYAHLQLAAADPEQRKSYGQREPAPTAETISIAAMRAAKEFSRGKDLVLKTAEVEHRISGSDLDRIVRELVENACKFSPPDSPIEIRSAAVEGMFRIDVVDSGRGFSPEQLRHIRATLQFDRKLQEQQGSGLGLAISERLAELYGGTMAIESVLGKGSSVVLQMPL
jgi:two-component system, sensor histidine kinase and response regulator